MKSALVAACALLLVGPGTSTRAQDRGQITVAAVVDVDPPTIRRAEDLEFGVLRQGAPTTVDARTSRSAAKLEIRGVSDVEYTVEFLLPETIGAGPGVHRLPVRFGPTGACISTNDDQTTCNPLDPTRALAGASTARAGALYIWLGASVDPGPLSVTGRYTGTVMATVQYTGI